MPCEYGNCNNRKMNRFDLTEFDKAILARIKLFMDEDIKHPAMLRNFELTRIGAKEFLNSNFKPNQFMDGEVDAIVKCADYNFSLWHNMNPNKNYDITIYLLSTLGASYAVDDLMFENKFAKEYHPLAISDSEEGEMCALKFLFKKYGNPRT